jgi:hypothetical protein
MESDRFDALTRSLTTGASRRGLLTGVTSGLLAVLPLSLTGAEAKKKRKNKKPKNCRTEVGCVPEPRNTTCGGHCGDRINNCGQTIGCPTCSGERVCLSNGSCAWPCLSSGCPSGCICSLDSAEGTSHCIANSSPTGQACTSTAECPHGQHCQNVMPGGQFCIGLC